MIALLFSFLALAGPYASSWYQVPSAPPSVAPASPAAPAAPATTATPVPVAPPTPAATPTPSAPPAGAPSATPAGTPPATPPVATPVGTMPAPVTTPAAPLASPPQASPTPSPYKYRFVPHQPDRLSAGQPQILAVYLNDRKLHSNGQILIRVQTNTDVVKVVSRSSGREGVIPPVSPGIFEAVSVLPKIPFIAAGMTVDLEFVATSADGRKASVRVPVRLD